MALIVHKYGGTSVGSTERIKNVARRVAKWHAAGHQLVVVPSAMSGETNRLIGLAKEISPNPDPRELDVIASTGEQVTIGLLAMALQAEGLTAKSYTGAQVRVTTDSAFTKARIMNIDDKAIRADLARGCVVRVASTITNCSTPPALSASPSCAGALGPTLPAFSFISTSAVFMRNEARSAGRWASTSAVVGCMAGTNAVPPPWFQVSCRRRSRPLRWRFHRVGRRR